MVSQILNRFIADTAAELDALWTARFGAWRRWWSARFQDAARHPNMSFWIGVGALAAAALLGAIFG